MPTNLLYDPAIRDMLRRQDASIEELKALRTRARTAVKEHGNLAAALVELEEEIERRTGGSRT